MSETEQKLRIKLKNYKHIDIDEVIKEVQENADWFLGEGGSDGTYAHMVWLEEYAHLKPEITKFAEECGGQI